MTGTKDSTGERVRRWLNPTALVFVALAAVMGWGASFVGLHAYAVEQMSGFAFWTGWLVPATFDGAAFGCTLITYRASVSGRSAVRGRVLMWVFTGISSWINWIHQASPDARAVAAGLPIAAVGVFEIVLIELRADHEARHGRTAFRLRPGLLLVRLLADRAGTTATLRTQITNIPVAELAGLATATPPSLQTTPNADPDSTSPAEPELAPEPDPQPTPQNPSRPAADTTDTTRAGSRLPAATVAKLQAARDQAQQQGREFQPADVQAVVKLPESLAADLAAEFTTNGHPAT